MSNSNNIRTYILISFTLASLVIGVVFYITSIQTAEAALAGLPIYNISRPGCPPHLQQQCPNPGIAVCNNATSNLNAGGCGTACEGGKSWSRYIVQCTQSSTFVCRNEWVLTGLTCSTGDKYNSSNPPVLKYGACDCSVGVDYRICCKGSTPVNATRIQVDSSGTPFEAICPTGSTRSGPSVVSCGSPPPTVRTIDFFSAVTSYPLVFIKNANISYTGGSCGTTCSFSTTNTYNGNFNITAPATYTDSGKTYNFLMWSVDNTYTNTSNSWNISLNDSFNSRSAVAVYTEVVPPPPAPSATINASPLNITSGASSTITWSSTDASSCLIDQGIGSVGTGGSRLVSPLANTTYTLSCTGAGGSASNSVTINVSTPPPPVPTASISAAPNPITVGATTTVSWSSTNATACVLNTSFLLGPSGSITASPPSTVTYSVVCTGANATSSPASVTVNVTAAPLPKVCGDGTQDSPNDFGVFEQCDNGASNGIWPATCSNSCTNNAAPSPTIDTLTASPQTILRGNSSIVAWTTSNTTSCTLDGVSVPLDGSSIKSPTTNRTYTLTCNGNVGSNPASASTNVIVNVTILSPAPTINASPAVILKGGSTILDWSASNINIGDVGCSIDQGIGAVAPSGTIEVFPPGTTTYTISCTNPQSTRSASVTVTVPFLKEVIPE